MKNIKFEQEKTTLYQENIMLKEKLKALEALEALERETEEMAENEKKSEILTTLQDMVFAYQNKDEDCPHDFEIEALTNAKKLLKKEGK